MCRMHCDKNSFIFYFYVIGVSVKMCANFAPFLIINIIKLCKGYWSDEIFWRITPAKRRTVQDSLLCTVQNSTL
jgi:hypothetical protein